MPGAQPCRSDKLLAAQLLLTPEFGKGTHAAFQAANLPVPPVVLHLLLLLLLMMMMIISPPPPTPPPPLLLLFGCQSDLHSLPKMLAMSAASTSCSSRASRDL
jgi:hypothetical protein